MKKRLLLIALLCLCLAICACQAEEREAAKTQDSKAASSTQQTQQTQESKETSAKLEQIIVDPVYYDLRSIEEYEAFIASQSNVPSDFVGFEKLEQFGAFRNFHCSHSIKEAGIDFTYYRYTLVDEAGKMLNIAIDHTPEEHNLSSVFRVIDNGKGVRHTYLSDDLFMIRWKSQGIEYTFSMDNWALKDYPAESSTLVSKLLDPNTAPDVLGEFFELDLE